MIASHDPHLLIDIWRLLVIAGGIGGIIIHLSDLADAYAHASPSKVRIGLTLRWLGHTLITASLTVVVIERLGEPINWYSPIIGASYALLIASVWITRKRDPIMEAAPDAHRVKHHHGQKVSVSSAMVRAMPDDPLTSEPDPDDQHVDPDDVEDVDESEHPEVAPPPE